jgi:hypothetical protein
MNFIRTYFFNFLIATISLYIFNFALYALNIEL